MTIPLPTWLVTIRRDEHRTYDHAIPARSAYSAGWIVRQMKPGARIIAIRLAQKPPHPGQASSAEM